MSKPTSGTTSPGRGPKSYVNTVHGEGDISDHWEKMVSVIIKDVADTQHTYGPSAHVLCLPFVRGETLAKE